MYIMLPAPKRSELWVSDIDGGNRVKLATGEDRGRDNWAPLIFTCLLMSQVSARGPKSTSSGPMAAVFVSSHGRETLSTMRYGAPTRNRFT